MGKVTKKELQYQINGLAAEASTRHNSIMRIHRALASIGVDIFSDDFDLTEPEPQPQLKQLDQSVFNGLDEKWKSAATNTDGKAYLHNMPKSMMYFNHSSYGWCSKDYDAHEMRLIGDGFDPSGFAVVFIERDDIAKELLEVDLSSELTGSDLCRAMLGRGDKFVMCIVSKYGDVIDNDSVILPQTVIKALEHGFATTSSKWSYAIPINNQGEPLTATDVGL